MDAVREKTFGLPKRLLMMILHRVNMLFHKVLIACWANQFLLFYIFVYLRLGILPCFFCYSTLVPVDKLGL